MNKKKIAAFMAAMALVGTMLPTNAFAITNNGDGTQTVTEADLDETGKTDVAIPVECTVGATFSVKLPSEIALTNTDGSWGYTGQVGVKGDIDAGRTVNVTPADSVTVYDVTCRPTSDVPASAEDQNYEHKDAKDVAVAQVKKSWTQTEINPDTYTDTDLTLTAGAMQSGTWRGSLDVNIEYAAPSGD